MPKIIWEKRFSSGVKVIDDQHLEMVNKINQLYNFDAGSLDTTLFREILDEFYIISAKHFRFEEYLMGQAGYKDLKEHAHEHAITLDKISALTEIMLDADTTVVDELRENFTRLIEDHLNAENYDYFADIRQAGEY